MNIEDKIEIHDCPVCGGSGILEEECGSAYYIMCMECGSQSVSIDFANDAERFEAAKKVSALWNSGKIIATGVGE